MTRGKADPLRKPVDTSDLQQTFFGYLVLQALVLLLWWPKSSLFERIGSTAEPTTLAAVVIFTGAALAWFTIQLGVQKIPVCRSETDGVQPWKTLGEFSKIHFIQLGYLMVLCAPITLIAHSIASMPATRLFWIALITAAHTSFYGVLASWLHLRRAQRDAQLLTNVLRVALVGISVCTTFYLPSLSHVQISRQLTQPVSDASGSIATMVLPFVVTYTTLGALLWVVLFRQLSQPMSDGVTKSESSL